MLRWGLLALGCWLLLSSGRADAPSRAAAFEGTVESLDRAIALASAGTERQVELEATLDATRRAYSTGLGSPAFSRCPAGAVHPLSRGDGDDGDLPRLAPLAGCPVEARGRAAREALVLEEYVLSGERGAPGERLLVPLESWGRRLWVLSTRFDPAGAGARAAWLRSDRFSGRLARLDDLAGNVPALRAAREIRAVLIGELGGGVPYEAYVIHCEPEDPWSLARARRERYLAPVAGSGGTLLVRIDRDQEASFDGVLRGRLRGSRASDLDGLDAALGCELPEWIGVVDLETQAPRATPNPHRGSAAGRRRTGAAFLVASAGAFALRRRRLRRERREIAAEVEARMERRG